MRLDLSIQAIVMIGMVALALAGCDGVQLPSLTGDLPPELAFVVENREMFAQDRSDPLKSVPPGTIIDDLTTLNGCWGAALLANVELDSLPLATVYFVADYRPASGEVRNWSLVEVLGRFRIAAGAGSGTFQTIDGNRLVKELLVSMPYDIETGEMETHEIADPIPKEFLATLDGDRLRLHFGDADRAAIDPGDDAVYRRFDCPE